MAKTKASGKKQSNKQRVKVGKLEVDKNAIKDVPGKQQRKIKGGQVTPFQKNPKPILLGL